MTEDNTPQSDIKVAKEWLQSVAIRYKERTKTKTGTRLSGIQHRIISSALYTDADELDLRAVREHALGMVKTFSDRQKDTEIVICSIDPIAVSKLGTVELKSKLVPVEEPEKVELENLDQKDIEDNKEVSKEETKKDTKEGEKQ